MNFIIKRISASLNGEESEVKGFAIEGAEFGEQRTAGGESVAWRNLETAVAPIASPNRYVTMCVINYHIIND